MKAQLSSLGVTAIQVLSPVLIALLGLLAKRLVDLINARVKNETVRGVLDRLDQTALAVVTEVQQTFVDHLDANSPADSWQKARDLALVNLKTLLGPKGLDDTKKVLGIDDGSLQKILITFVESKVHELRTAAPPVVAAPVVVQKAASAG
jgi:hypothetical protein